MSNLQRIDAKKLLINELYFSISTDNYAKNIVIEETLLDVVRALENGGYEIVKVCDA